MGPRVDATSTAAAASRGFDTDLIAQLQGLSPEAWEFAFTQSRQGGQVSDANPELFAFYREWLKQTKGKDSFETRAGFLDQLSGRLEAKARDQFAGTGVQPLFKEAVKLMGSWSADDEKEFQATRPQTSGGAERERRSDKFQAHRPTAPQNGPIRIGTVEEYYPTNAKTPDEALAMRTDKVAGDDKLFQKIKTSFARGTSAFTGPDGEVARRTYNDFLSRTGRGDSPASRQLFVDFLTERRTATQANGGKGLDAKQDKRFYADAALRRLAERAKAGGPIELGDEDRWMISALTDPTVKYTPEEQQVVDRVQWHTQGLRSQLWEVAAKRKAASEWRPGLGQPYKATLNASTVFDGDPQKNAFSMAARGAGYTPEEIDFAAKYVTSKNIGLYVDRDQSGEPQINRVEDAKAVTVGGQRFVPYTMSRYGAEVLRDARYALQHGYASVDDYRKDFDSTWSDKVGSLGSTYLAMEQAKDRAFGLEQNAVTGPLVRGKYDAMRELLMVGSNAAQFAQMFVSNTGQFLRTGDPMISLADSEELSRYFDNGAQRVENTFVELGKTYTAEEQNMAAEIARGVVGSAPKMAVNLVPGAAIYYNALKHFNHPIDEFARETVIDLASVAGGFALSGVGGAATKFATRFVDSQLAKTVVTQVVSRGAGAVGGATLNVALDMGPAAMKQYFTDPDKLTQKEKDEIAKTLTTRAFTRNVCAGMVFGLVFPANHKAEDHALLSLKSTEVEGPIFRVRTPDGGEHFYSAVETEKFGTQFIEADPQNPKVAKKIQAGEVKDARQSDVDLALAESRFSRLSEQGKKDLIAGANKYAAQTTLLEAEQGVQLKESGGTDVAAGLTKSIEARKTLKQTAAGASGGRLDQLTTMEMGKVDAQKFYAAFGEGPYDPQLMKLFGEPGFGDFVTKNPKAAGELYSASLKGDVFAALESARTTLKPKVPYTELPGRVFETVVKGLDAPVDPAVADGRVLTRNDASMARQQALAGQRALVNERLKPPTPLVLDGQSYDVVGVGSEGGLQLKRAAAPHAFVEMGDATKLTAQLDGKPARILEVMPDTEGGLAGVKVESGGKTVVIDSTEAQRLTVTRDGETFALKGAGHKVMRFDNVDVAVKSIPLEQVPEGTQVRLKGREGDGAFTLVRNEDGTLGAIGRGPKGEPLTVKVRAEDIAGRYVTEHNSALGDVQIDSARKARSNDRTGPLTDPGIGALEGGKITIADGNTVMRELTDTVKRSKGSLSVAMFEVAPGANGPTAEMFQALLDHAKTEGPDGKPQQVTIINTSGRPIPAEVQARLDAAGVKVVTPTSNGGAPVVNHMKGVVAGDTAAVSTASVNPGIATKVEAVMLLSPEAAKVYGEYLDLLSKPNTDVQKRAPVLARLAELGVVINDPQVHQGMYAARTINGLVSGASKTLDVHIKELKSVELTANLIERARSGVQVDITVRTLEGFDVTCQRMLAEAKAKDPSLKLEFKVHPDSKGAPHASAIIADGNTAYVGSAFGWGNQLTTVAPDGVSFENGVVVQGDQARAVQQQMRALERERGARRPEDR